MEATQEMEEQAKDPQEWALDWTGTEGASVLEHAKQMNEQEPEPAPEGRGDGARGREPRGDSQPDPYRMEMGEDLLETTVSNAGSMLFDGLSWAAGQDMTLEPDESRELTKYATPVVKHRLPRGKRYLPDTLLACYLINLMYKKFDVQKVL
jgi:hypothetical protein